MLFKPYVRFHILVKFGSGNGVAAYWEISAHSGG